MTQEQCKKEAASIVLAARASGCSLGIFEELIEDALIEAYEQGRNEGMKFRFNHPEGTSEPKPDTLPTGEGTCHE